MECELIVAAAKEGVAAIIRMAAFASLTLSDTNDVVILRAINLNGTVARQAVSHAASLLPRMEADG